MESGAPSDSAIPCVPSAKRVVGRRQGPRAPGERAPDRSQCKGPLRALFQRMMPDVSNLNLEAYNTNETNATHRVRSSGFAMRRCLSHHSLIFNQFRAIPLFLLDCTLLPQSLVVVGHDASVGQPKDPAGRVTGDVAPHPTESAGFQNSEWAFSCVFSSLLAWTSFHFPP